MESQPNEMTMRDIVKVAVRRRLAVIGVVVGCIVLALAYTLVQTPNYSAESEVLVQTSGRDPLLSQTSTLSDRSIQTQLQVIESPAVRERVMKDLDLAALPPEVEATAVPQTDVISLEVRAGSADNAARYANAYASAYIDVRRDQVLAELLAAGNAVQIAIDAVQADLDAVDALESVGNGAPNDVALADALANFPSRTALADQLAEFSTTLNQLRVDAALRTGGTTIIRVAEVPGKPVGLIPVFLFPLAVAIGLVLGLLAALLIDHLDDKIRTEDDLSRLVTLPVLATVPVAKQPDSRLIAISEPGNSSVEAYRDLRTNLRFLGLNRDVRVIQVTSPTDSGGKTSTAANLSVVLAQAGNRVALVDANLRMPKVHEVLALPQAPGFTDMLLGKAASEAVNDVIVDDVNTLSAYTSGLVPTNPSELLSGQRTQQLIKELGAKYDYVIVDSASVLAVSDAVELSGSVDALLLVVQAGRTTREQLAEALGRLDQVDAPVAGIVFNGA